MKCLVDGLKVKYMSTYMMHDALYVVYLVYHLYPDQDARVLQRLNDVTTSGALRGHQGAVVRHAVNLKLLNSDI